MFIPTDNDPAAFRPSRRENNGDTIYVLLVASGTEAVQIYSVVYRNSNIPIAETSFWQKIFNLGSGFVFFDILTAVKNPVIIG